MAKICPNCHAEMMDKNLFCTACGTKLDQEPLEITPESREQPVKPEPEMPEQPAEEVSEVPEQPAESAPASPEPSDIPEELVIPVLDEKPVYSVNAVRPAESQYTVPTQPYQSTYPSNMPQYTPFAPYASAAPVKKKKRTGLLILIIAIIAAVIAVLSILAVGQGWFSDKHQLDGDYTLTTFISGGQDYSTTIAPISNSYIMNIRGEECTMTLGEGSDTYRFTIDQVHHTLSNGKGVSGFTVSGSQITFLSGNNVLTFTKR